MTLIDTGPILAILDQNDRDHLRCVAASAQVATQLVTTVAVITEAMHFLGHRVGWAGQERLLRLVLRGDMLLHDLTSDALERVSKVLAKYRGVPMDFADATLVVAAEDLQTDLVFTLDSDFRVYRWGGKRAFRILPDR